MEKLVQAAQAQSLAALRECANTDKRDFTLLRSGITYRLGYAVSRAG